MWPPPVGRLLRVNALEVGGILRLDLGVKQQLSEGTTLVAQKWHIVERRDGETVSIDTIANSQLERCVDVALLAVSRNNPLGALAVVGHSVNQPWVGVEVKNDGLVLSEEGLELIVTQTVGMVVMWDQLEQVDDVDKADLDLWQMLPEEGNSSKRLLCWDITTRDHDDIGLLVFAVGGKLPDSNALGAVNDSIVHVEVLEMFLLIGNNDVDVIGAAKTVVCH